MTKQSLLMKRFTFISIISFSISFFNNTTLFGQDKPKQEIAKQSSKPSVDKAKIKEIPKAKKQVKPIAVKPNIKVKPIKIVKPKIKKP